MNILVFSWRDPKHPLAGGAEQVMHEHMKGWIGAGHNVTLFSSRMKSLPKHEMLDGVEIIRGGYQYWGVQFAGFFYYLKNENDYDLVVDQFHGIPFFTPLYCRKPKLAVIQEVARIVWLRNPLPFPINYLIGIIGYLGEPFVFWIYKRTPFMTGSKSAKSELVKMGISGKNITVVPHGVLVEKSKVKYQKSKVKTITYLGILSKDKGIEDAVRVFKLLDEKGSYQFWVIGKPETKSYEKKVKNLVKRLGLEKKVKFWGFVSQEMKFELLAKSHVLVNPSIHEGWGLINIESNSVGTPVVSYNSPGLIDSVKNGVSGLICRNNSPEEMAKEVFNLLTNRRLYKRLQEGAISWSEIFNWELSVKQGLTLISNVVRFKKHG